MKSPHNLSNASLGDDQKDKGRDDGVFQTVLERAQNGDEVAKSDLCAYVWKVAYRRAVGAALPTVYEVRDFAQDVVIQFLEQLARIRDLDKWLLRVCFGVRARAFRNHHQKFLALFEAVFQEEFDSFETTHLAKIEVETLLKDLEPLHRKVVCLRYQDGLPFVEIAKIMRMSEGAVKNVFWRTKSKLKSLLDPQSGESHAHASQSRRT